MLHSGEYFITLILYYEMNKLSMCSSDYCSETLQYTCVRWQKMIFVLLGEKMPPLSNCHTKFFQFLLGVFASYKVIVVLLIILLLYVELTYAVALIFLETIKTCFHHPRLPHVLINSWVGWRASVYIGSRNRDFHDSTI